jgi:outer membrane receptor protein involved in Fe transport
MTAKISSRLSRFALLAATSCLPGAALAQDGEPREPIVVTGRGLDETPANPAYGTIEIPREAIATSASGRIEDVLSSVAGFQQFRRSDSRSSNPSAQGVTLRALGGNATSRALVLLDGVPMADPFFGYMPLNALAPERLETIRVTRGGGTGPFGAGALAGTIELDSADAARLGLVSGQALVNDRGETELSGAIAPQLGKGFAEVSGRWDRGKGFFTAPKSQRVPASVRARYDSWSASARLVQPLGDNLELQLRGLAYDDDRVLRFDGAKTGSKGEDISARLVSRGPWQVDAVAYAQWRNFHNIVISSSSFAKVLDQRDTPSSGLGGKIEVRPPVGGGHTLRLGGDFRRSEGDLEEYRFFSSGASNGSRFAGGVNKDFGFFVEDDWELDRLTITAGLRGDRWSVRNGYHRNLDAAGGVIEDSAYPGRKGWDWSYRGGAVLDAGSGVQLRAAAYSGLRLPTLNELYRPFVVFPVRTDANAELRNERLEGFEAGIDWRPADGVKLSLTAFDNKVKHAIANVTIATNLRQRRNVDAIDAQGLELGAALRFGQLSFDGSLAVTDADVKGSGVSAALDGMRPSQTPKFSASGTLAWQPREGWRLAATLRHVGKQYEDDLETNALPSATTLDAYAEIPVTGPFSLVIRGENLTDEKIVTRDQRGSIDLGVPRTVWAGIKLRLGG